MNLKVAIVTCSSTRDISQDTAGKALEERIKAQGWKVAGHIVVDDDVMEIATGIRSAATMAGADVVLTCGGTGMSLRDVAPEATRSVCSREVPGIAEEMRRQSLSQTRNALISRACAMQMDDGTLVVNLPGSQKAATECFDAVYDVFEHAYKMTQGEGHEKGRQDA
jgi:molybdenum cofactor synthesis domain-containing protein